LTNRSAGTGPFRGQSQHNIISNDPGVMSGRHIKKRHRDRTRLGTVIRADGL
jgi:hypothetical protein